MTRLIDEEEAFKVLSAYYKHRTPVQDSALHDALSKVPTAVPVRHGKFIGTEYDGYADGNPVYYEWKCSECGCIFEDDEPTYRYCPNCGARMDKDE